MGNHEPRTHHLFRGNLHSSRGRPGYLLGRAEQRRRATSTRDTATGNASPRTRPPLALTTSATAPKFILLGCNNDAQVAPAGTSALAAGTGPPSSPACTGRAGPRFLRSGYGTYIAERLRPPPAWAGTSTPTTRRWPQQNSARGRGSTRRISSTPKMTLIFTGTPAAVLPAGQRQDRRCPPGHPDALGAAYVSRCHPNWAAKPAHPDERPSPARAERL